MRIVVPILCVEQLSEADEVALALAFRVALWDPAGWVTAVLVGDGEAGGVMRTALVRGAFEGVHVRDDALSGCDQLAASRVLAAVVERLGFDLVIAGTAAAEPGQSAVPAMLAERLGVPALCGADTLTVTGRQVRIRRADATGSEELTAELPAVVSVTERCGEPRPSGFTAVATARHKRVRTWSLSDLRVDRAAVGPKAAALPGPRRADGGRRRIVVDGPPAEAAEQLATFLTQRAFL